MEVDGVLAGHHLVLPRAAGALLLLRHPSLSLLLLRLLAAAAAAAAARDVRNPSLRPHKPLVGSRRYMGGARGLHRAGPCVGKGWALGRASSNGCV